MEYGEYSILSRALSPAQLPPWAAVASAAGTCLWVAGWLLAGLGGMERSSFFLIPVSLAFLDSGQYLSSGEGMFRRPSEGQSLISYLSEQDFGSCADLEKVREAAAACVHWRIDRTAGSGVLPAVGKVMPWYCLLLSCAQNSKAELLGGVW